MIRIVPTPRALASVVLVAPKTCRQANAFSSLHCNNQQVGSPALLSDSITKSNNGTLVAPSKTQSGTGSNSVVATRLVHCNQLLAKQQQKLFNNKNFAFCSAIRNSSSSSLSTMSGIQKLVTEPSRELIDNIRQTLYQINAKDNSEQEITCEKDAETGIATVKIKSAAKNGISGKMMCDFLDVIDQLYAWDEGKGVIVYGHGGFFCSGTI